MIPDELQVQIEETLFAPIQHITPLNGGDSSLAFKLELEDRQAFFLKYQVNPLPHVFEQEAKGLQLLSEAETELKIPEVIQVGDQHILLEFIEEHSQGSSFEFGTEMARLHRHSNELYGFTDSNFIGSIPQSNRYHAHWLEFFIRERIEPLVKKAINDKLLSNKYVSIFERVFNYTYVIFPEEPPSLLHGDFWSGNYFFCANGQTALFDPAVYFGHREMDLAMSTLFGGFEPAFYDGYMTEYPLEPGFEERFKLCQLYPILVHALLFKGHYVQQAKSLLDRFF